ncbi:MAG: glycoside hydrolase family 97 catalytic domain-containing protein [Oscillospiraceae bacterium]
MSVHVLHSPENRVTVTLSLDRDGSLFYRTEVDGHSAVALSPLGTTTTGTDFTRGLRLVEEGREAIDETYSIPAFKKSSCPDRANCLSLLLEKEGKQLLAEARAYDDGGAVRLTLLGKGPVEIPEEYTGFAVPEQVGNLYAQKLVFSYEDHYHPVPREDLHQNPYAFPLLAELGGGRWALYAEAPVYAGTYGGSNLLSTPETPSLLMTKKSPDKLTPIRGELPFSTPWRVALAGSLCDIAASNLLENLNPPSIVADPSFIKPGRLAWSWMTENDSPTDPKRMKDYIDYAAAMGFEYSLIDGGWPGHIDIPEMVAYASEKGVGIWVWEHSADMREQKEAEDKLRLWSGWGVKGVKIDFFESDAQERIVQYNMLAELAAKYRLMLNFHGCSKPTGTSRVWPHVLSYEGVQGGEYLQNFSTFTPSGPDAAHNCTLPFTRGAVGPMDYTPVVYKTYTTGTTDAHQTALPVIFTSYALHIGEGAELVMAHPFRPFLEAVPTAWDETIVLEGCPASYVTMARRSGSDWFVAGICARRPRNATISFDFLGEGGYTAELYADDLSDLRPFDPAVGALPAPTQADSDAAFAARMRECAHQHDIHLNRTERLTVKKGDVLTIPMNVNGGFAMRIMPK